MNKSVFNMLSFVFPQRCAECSDFCTGALCEKCFKKLKRLTSYTCQKCGKPLGSCICKSLSLEFQRSVSAFSFEDPCVASLIYKLKSKGTKITSDFLGKSLAEKIKREYGDISFDLITHVPVTRKQLAKNGYDHAGLIAVVVAEELGIPFIKSPLIKVGRIKQKYLDLQSRKKNVRKMFYIRKNTSLFGSVLLIDDVMTTGSTLSFCSELLKGCGAEKIYAATVATAVKN